MATTLLALLALAIGFLLGSVLPADILARRQGVDIRSVGDGNPGTWNAFGGLGWKAGLLTAVYDISVGVVAIQIAKALGVSDELAYAAGIMAIVGHRFPVFRGFHGGGQGMGATVGMLVYGVVIAVGRGWLSLVDLAVLVAVLAVTFGLTRSGPMLAIVMLPFLVAEVFLARPGWPFALFMSLLAAHIWIVQVSAARRQHPLGDAGLLQGHTRN